MRVIDWLAKHERYSPGRLAIVETGSGRQFTYSEFNQQANRVCGFLRKIGVVTGDRVAALLPNCADVLFTLFGATKLGAVFAPLNYKLAARELATVVNDARPSVLLYSAEFAALAGEIRGSGTQVIALEDAAREITRCPDDNPPKIPVDMEAAQMLLYTSGTTGAAKGVIISHRMTLWNSINTSIRMLIPGDTVLVHTPMFYTGGLNVYTLPSFYLGGTVAIMPSFDAAGLLRAVEQQSVTVLFGVPAQLAMIADQPTFPTADLSSLRVFMSGGAPCPVPLVERYRRRGILLRQGFGLTEVGPNCFALEARDVADKPASIGYPNFAMEARIVDDAGSDMPDGETGELALRSPAMFSGYWNNPALTAQAVRDGWFFTGDMAMRDGDGCFYIVGRKKDMFISGGENVYAAEIENVLRDHPKVSDVAVVGQPHPKWGEAGCAVVVVKPGESLSAEDVIRWCSGRIGRFKIPKTVVFMDDLPRTHSGKVNKDSLRAMTVSH